MSTFSKKDQILKEIIKFGIVGCFAVAVQYIVYYFCLFFINHNISFIIGYVISFIVNYILTTNFTFRTQKTVNNGIGFTLCHLINFLMQIFLLNIFIYFGISKQIAPIPVFAICVPTNFMFVRFVMKKL